MRAIIHSRDIKEINRWLEARGMEKMIEKELPRYGMIEEDVACGFICLTDSTVCFLECFISNPDATPEERDEAISDISIQLVGKAANAGFRRCLVISKEKSLIERAIDLGFKENKSTVLYKDF